MRAYQIICLLGVIMVLSLLTVQIWNDWSSFAFRLATGDIGTSFVATFLVLFLEMTVLPLMTFSVARGYLSGHRALARALARALETGDATVAPLATEPATKATASSGERAGGDTFTVALPEPLMVGVGGVAALYTLSALALITAIAVGVVAAVMLLVRPGTLPSSRVDAITPIAICLGLALATLGLYQWGRRRYQRRARQQQGVTVSVDGAGLIVHGADGRGAERALTWADIRAFGWFSFKDERTLPHAVRLIVGREWTFFWVEPPTERYISEDRKHMIAALQRNAERLHDAVVARTGLQARDLTATVSTICRGDSTAERQLYFVREAYLSALAEGHGELAASLWRAQSPTTQRQPRALRRVLAAPLVVVARGTSARPRGFASVLGSERKARLQEVTRLAQALLPYFPIEREPEVAEGFSVHTRQDRVRERVLAWINTTQIVVVGALVITLVATSAALWFSERSAAALMEAIPAQVAAQPPVYYASLNEPQAGWKIQQPTRKDPSSLSFTNGGYQLANSDPNAGVLSWIPHEYSGDMAITARVTFTGDRSTPEYVAASIVFDLNPVAGTTNKFGVDDQGNWFSLAYNPNVPANEQPNALGIGFSPAINTGMGASNTLLLVRHGPFYLAYVTGALVSRIYATSDAPQHGSVGVSIDGAPVIARFNDFAIYPVPPSLASVPLNANLPFWLSSER